MLSLSLYDLATLLALRGARSAGEEGISSSNCQHCQSNSRQAGPGGALSSSPSRAAAAGRRVYWRGSGHSSHGGSTSPAQPSPSWPLLQPPTGKGLLLKLVSLSVDQLRRKYADALQHPRALRLILSIDLLQTHIWRHSQLHVQTGLINDTSSLALALYLQACSRLFQYSSLQKLISSCTSGRLSVNPRNKTNSIKYVFCKTTSTASALCSCISQRILQ